MIGASRTDAGVHALGQVASVHTPAPLAPETAMAALNARLPRDIRVLGTQPVPIGFDARRAGRLKRYGYLLATDPVRSPFLRGVAWQIGQPLDVPAMADAAAGLRGKHDFSAFCAAAGRGRTPVCTVRSARVVRWRGRLVVMISADSFLHHMVRNLIGTLVEIGRGARRPEWIRELLDGRDRTRSGPTAPSQGLVLVRVMYSSAIPEADRGGMRLGRVG